MKKFSDTKLIFKQEKQKGLAGAVGIEPTSLGLESKVLPLHHTPVGREGKV